MKNNSVTLKNVIREDINRLILWLQDPEIYESWFGRYTYNQSAHLGYEPEEMLHASEDEWNEVFHDPHHEPHRSIFSIYQELISLKICSANLKSKGESISMLYSSGHST